MESLKQLFKIGVGPSSSHTYGPKLAAQIIKEKYQNISHIEVTLYGSLSLTGKGHLTDYIIEKEFAPIKCEFIFNDEPLPYHPNGMVFKVFTNDGTIEEITAYSVGGGKIEMPGVDGQKVVDIYPQKNMTEIIEYIEHNNISFYDYVLECEGEEIVVHLNNVLDAMIQSVENGLAVKGTIPGKLKLERVAKLMHGQALNTKKESERERLLVSSYAYAVSEENACGNVVVTAPTCGASGVIPAVIYYCYKQLGVSRQDLVKALAIAGLFGNVIKTNATISGADGGCQAEIGSACSMAAAMYAWVLELNNSAIEYAAEMGMEHNLGLTCDPVGGYVQIPCIERNGFGALRAMDAAVYAKQLGYIRKNKISFDAVVKVMYETGKDLNSAYKETSLGGLASNYEFKKEL